jgi:iron complex outermembrane recepter protein
MGWNSSTWQLIAALTFTVSAAGRAALADPAPSTDAGSSANDLMEITVTGIRASLDRAQQIKKDAPQVVEAVTLEDLGKFADSDVADTLQRVPGVDIDRNDNGVSGDRVTIRGLGPAYTQVTVNGRVVLTGGDEGIINMRQFNFDVLPTETISGLLIYKTPTAEMPESGLAGTVDVRTLRPLDYRSGSGNAFGSLSAFESHDDQSRSTRPRFSGSLGGKFLDDTLGVFGTFMTSKQDVANNELFSRFATKNLQFADNGNGVVNRTIDNVLVPSQITTDIDKGTITRHAFSGSVQWKPSDRFELNGDFEYSEIKNDQDRIYGDLYIAGQGIYSGVASPGGYTVADGNLVAFDTSKLTYPAGTTPAIGFTPYPLLFNNDQALYSGGLNAVWSGEQWKLKGDAGYSDSTFKQDLRLLVGSSPALNNNVSFDGRSTVPTISGVTNVFAPPGSETNVSFKHVNLNSSKVLSFKLDFDYDVNSNFKLKTGYRRQVTDVHVSGYSNLDIAPDAASGFTDAVATKITTTQVTNTPSGYLSKYGFGINLPYSSYYLNGPLLPAIVYGGYPDPTADTGIAFATTETTNAFYVQSDGVGNIFSLPAEGNAGIRVVETELTSNAQSTVIVSSPLGPQLSSTRVPDSDKNSYWTFLPAANLNLHVSDNTRLRLGVSRVMSRPEYNLTAPINTLYFLDPNNPLTDKSQPPGATAGNTKLKPLTAWQFDTTAEYYTANRGALYASFFYKRVSDFILTVNETGVTLPGQGATLFDVTYPFNSKRGTVKGAELGFDQPLSFLPSMFDGLGIQANYTYVDSSVSLATGALIHGFPGASKTSVNSVLYYEKYGIGARLAYAYRSDYLASLTDSRTGQPTFTEGYGQLNASLSYKIVPHVEITLSGVNLTNADRRDYISDRGMFKSFVQRSKILSAGIRGTF